MRAISHKGLSMESLVVTVIARLAVKILFIKAESTGLLLSLIA